MGTATTCTLPQERTGVITFKGNALTLLGPAIKAGDKAPDFHVTAQDLSEVSLSQFAGKPILISVTPSLDTPVCDQQARRFNEEAAKLKGVEVLNISVDLPFAQKRWCGAAGAANVKVFSDYKKASFGKAYGALIKELRLLTRAVFAIDAGGTVRYAEYVPEVTTHPNYDAALAAVRQIAK